MRIKSIAGAGLLAALLLGGATLPGCETTPRTHVDDQHARSLTQAGQERIREGRLDEALQLFIQALRENPRLVQAHMGVGEVFRTKGDYDRAGEAYETAVKLAPSSFDANYYLGLVRQLGGRLQEAVRAYLRALTIRPDDFDANQNLASAYLQLNRPSDALPYAQRATELGPSSAAAWSNLATAYSLLHQYPEAVSAYRQASELFGENIPPQIMLGIADAHIQLENYDRAIAVLQMLVRKNADPVAYERIGFARFKQRRYNDALSSFRAALAIDPNDVASLNGLGVAQMTLYIQAGRQTPTERDDAIDAWRHSLKLKPDQAKIVDLVARYQKL